MKSRLDINNLLIKSGGCVLAPSILSANFACLHSEIMCAKKAGADILHLDIMDGHFVRDITFGPPVVRCIAEENILPLEAHLMIDNPIEYGRRFAEIGVDLITAHIEVLQNPKQWQQFKDATETAIGISLNPETQIQDPSAIVDFFDLILVMSVYPGKSGQKFIPSVLPKIEKIADCAAKKNLVRFIAVDGGINIETSRLVREAGANFIVAGDAFFGNGRRTYEETKKMLKGEKL